MQQKKSKSCFTWGFGCLSIFILIVSLMLNGVLSFVVFAGSITEDTYNEKLLSEIVVVPSVESKSKIAIIPIKGVIQHQQQSTDFFGSSQSSAELTIQQIRQAVADPNVKAILLDVDSPGGTVSASDVVYNEILEAKALGMVFVSYFGETAASGAYYVSAPSQIIVAEPSSLVGSIGVIFSGVNFTDLLNNVGVKEQVYKSGEHKDIFSSTRYPTESDDEIILSLVKHSYDQFTGIVKENRPIKSSDFDVAFDGRVFSSSQALDLGLIDIIGYKDLAIKETAIAADLTDYSLVQYKQPVGFGSLFSGLGVLFENKSILEKIPGLIHEGQPQLMYLWK